MKEHIIKFLGILLGITIIAESCYISLSNSISDTTIKESIKTQLLTGLIYNEDGSKTDIFNTIINLTKLEEETVIKIMENQKANEIITDILNSIYDYNLTNDPSYKYTNQQIIDIVNNNIDQILTEINYSISPNDKKEIIEYTKNNTDYIIDIIYSTDIGDYKK